MLFNLILAPVFANKGKFKIHRIDLEFSNEWEGGGRGVFDVFVKIPELGYESTTESLNDQKMRHLIPNVSLGRRKHVHIHIMEDNDLGRYYTHSTIPVHVDDFMQGGCKVLDGTKVSEVHSSTDITYNIEVCHDDH